MSLTLELEAASRRVAESKVESEAKAAKQRLATVERETEGLVAQLYGLTEQQAALILKGF